MTTAPVQPLIPSLATQTAKTTTPIQQLPSPLAIRTPTRTTAQTAPAPMTVPITPQTRHQPLPPTAPPDAGNRNNRVRTVSSPPSIPPSLPPLTHTQSESTIPSTFVGRMRPHPSIDHHPTFPILLHYATHGCPVDCGEPWLLPHLDAAVKRGAHPSACTPDAQACLRKETFDKVQQGQAKLIPWAVLRKNLPPNLKISPLAAVPHKS